VAIGADAGMDQLACNSLPLLPGAHFSHDVPGAISSILGDRVC
jgi:hypothetical protein